MHLPVVLTTLLLLVIPIVVQSIQGDAQSAVAILTAMQLIVRLALEKQPKKQPHLQAESAMIVQKLQRRLCLFSNQAGSRRVSIFAPITTTNIKHCSTASPAGKHGKHIFGVSRLFLALFFVYS